MRTPLLHAGVLAVPVRPGWSPVARELECLGAEVALRLEVADLRAQLAGLRMATRQRAPLGATSDCPPRAGRCDLPSGYDQPAVVRPLPWQMSLRALRVGESCSLI